MVDINTISSQFASQITETQGTGSTTSPGKISSDSTIPEATLDTINNLLKEQGLPILSAPAGPLSLDTLLSAVGQEVRQQACKDGVQSLETKGAQQKEINEKQLQEIADRLEEMSKKSILNGFMKAFQIIGVIVGVIASVASVAAGAVTGNPLLIAAGVAGMAMSIDGIVSLASDGKYSLMAGVTELAKKCGASDTAAQWIAFGVQMLITVATIAVSLGGSFGSAGSGVASAAGAAAKTAGTAAQTAGAAASTATKLTSESINTAQKILVYSSRIANVVSGVNSVASGSTTIANAVVDYNISSSYAKSKDLEAILERLRESMEADRKLVEAEMERTSDLMGKVMDIVNDCNSAQQAVLGNVPAMA